METVVNVKLALMQHAGGIVTIPNCLGLVKLRLQNEWELCHNVHLVCFVLSITYQAGYLMTKVGVVDTSYGQNNAVFGITFCIPCPFVNLLI